MSSYSNAKKLIYQIEKEHVAGKLNDGIYRDDDEEEALIGEHEEGAANATFRKFLNKELDRICSFYEIKETELLKELESLQQDVEDVEENGYIFWDGLDNGTSRGNASFPFFGNPNKRRASIQGVFKKGRRKRGMSIGEESHGDDSDDEEHTQAPAHMAASRSTIDDHHEDIPPRTPGTDSMYSEGGRSGRRQSLGDDIGSAQRARPSSGIWGDQHEYAIDARIRFKRRIIDLYVHLSELKSFINLNQTGFVKALKKYDKIVGESLKEQYIQNVVKQQRPFQNETKANLEKEISSLEEIYAKVIRGDDLAGAKRELKAQLREHVVWERNTIWRDMIGQERRSQGLGIKSNANGTPEAKEISTPVGMVNVSPFFTRSAIILIVAFAVLIALVNAPIFAEIEERNCLALLVFVSILWATEVIPLFTTSLLVPALVVLFRVLRSDDGKDRRLEAPEATKYIFAAMFSPVIMLLLGGFAIAGALSKYHIAKLVATWVLSKAGTRPSRVLLANMFVATFASMWISNVAAPVLCFSLIQPILRTLPPNSTFSKCLILGIALASNIGGMASPIASPQNIVALQNMTPTPTWLEWFFIALPVCIVSLFLIWGLLLWSYRSGTSTTLHVIRPSKDPFTLTQWYITIITFLTVALWCVEKSLEPYFGDMGVIAVFPLVAFFGTGVLTKEDFNNFLWTVIVLAMGGIALGKAVQSSGLLHAIAGAIQTGVTGLNLWLVLCVFASLVLVMATFISHTVAALIILPIVAQVGSALEDPHPRLLVMGAALCCSAAMGLPVSGFPNMNAIMLENEMGQRYLSVNDFLKNGILASVLTLGVIVTVGYLLMHVVGF